MNRKSLGITLAGLAAVGALGVATSALALTGGAGDGDRRSVSKAQNDGQLNAQIERLVADSQRQRAALEPALKERKAALAMGRRSSRSSVITACVNKRTKVMTVKGSCTRQETTISWNAAGARGAAGPAGPAGAPGATGPGGPAGASGSHIFYEDVFGPYSVGAGAATTGTNLCSAGGFALNGGFLPNTSDFVLRANNQDASYANGWFSSVENLGSSTGSVYILVYCVL